MSDDQQPVQGPDTIGSVFSANLLGLLGAVGSSLPEPSAELRTLARELREVESALIGAGYERGDARERINYQLFMALHVRRSQNPSSG